MRKRTRVTSRWRHPITSTYDDLNFQIFNPSNLFYLDRIGREQKRSNGPFIKFGITSWGSLYWKTEYFEISSCSFLKIFLNNLYIKGRTWWSPLVGTWRNFQQSATSNKFDRSIHFGTSIIIAKWSLVASTVHYNPHGRNCSHSEFFHSQSA